MTYLNNIPSILKRLLMIVAVVLVLGGCGETDKDIIIGEACVGDNTKGCVDTSDKKCLSCEILVMIYDAVGNNVGILYKTFTKASMPIMMIGFVIWLALRLLKFVSSVTETNVAEVWNEILKKAAICLICGLLASSSGLKATMNTIIFPIYSAFLDLGIQILDNSEQNEVVNSAVPKTADFRVFGANMTVADVDIKCKLSGSITSSGDGETLGFPSAIRNSLECMIHAVSRYLTIGGDVALTAMKQTKTITGVVMGIFLFLTFWIVKVSFVFYLVDTIFQMGLIILMLPLFILSFAFGPTKKWTSIGFKQSLASASFMMCFSILVAMVLRAMTSLINSNPSIFDPDPPEAAMEDISMGFICLLLIAFVIYGSMGVAQQLTSSLLGANVDNKFQQNLKGAVVGLGKAVLSAFGALITWGVSLLPQSQIKLVRTVARGVSKINEAKAKMDRWAGRS